MRIQLVTGSLSRLSGGLFFSVRHLASALAARNDLEVGVTGCTDAWTSEDLAHWRGLDACALPVRGPRRLSWMPGLRNRLREAEPDLVHLQFLWSYPSISVRQWSRSTGRPHMVSPRGMLDPGALALSAWKKRLAGRLFENSNLRESACLHALSEAELEAMRAHGLRGPVCVIPNGVDLAESIPNRDNRPPPWTLLFLGRLHPKKGLDETIRAWAEWRRAEPGLASHWRLQIAGWDDGGHEPALRHLTAALGAETSISFSGQAYGEDKDRLLREADAFILASHSEGLPMAVLEAWAMGMPTVISPQCHLPEGFQAGAAILTLPTKEHIVEALHQLASLTDSQRVAMGAQGRRLVAESFTWSSVAQRLHSVYAWLLDGAAKPACVHD
ncbi:MAG: glycosyltransferase [Verrucomicrobiales bacterium]